MIKLPDVQLPMEMQHDLVSWQRSIDSVSGYSNQVEEGKRLFLSRRRSPRFGPVKRTLSAMCSGVRRCHYCEDSAATDVEHIWPQEYYPDKVFVWENYLYSCARCNRPKSTICDIFLSSNGLRVSVPETVAKRRAHPSHGDPLLINPRLEDPLEHMILDLRDTFRFVPVEQRGTRSYERARHTIDVLKLNEEDLLPAARAEAYDNYISRLEKYVNVEQEGGNEEKLMLLQQSMMKMAHPSVWLEMKRQRTSFSILSSLFYAVPTALQW